MQNISIFCMKEVAMLIEFRVKNFRSIRNELVLSLVVIPQSGVQ